MNSKYNTIESNVNTTKNIAYINNKFIRNVTL